MYKSSKNIIGKKFGKLTALHCSNERSNKGEILWLFKCDCGNEVLRNGTSVRKGNTLSCGCLIGAKRTHGMTKSNTYRIWVDIKTRCSNKKNRAYKNYGGRGIKVCKRWMKFENFIEDMGERPKGLSIDRTNNNGNYEPNNCRWATMKEQQNNRRNNRLITYKGKKQNNV